MKNLKLEELISENETHRTFKAKMDSDVFVKEYKNNDPHRRQIVEKEIYFHHSLQHKNIVKLVDAYQNKKFFYLVF